MRKAAAPLGPSNRGPAEASRTHRPLLFRCVRGPMTAVSPVRTLSDERAASVGLAYQRAAERQAPHG